MDKSTDVSPKSNKSLLLLSILGIVIFLGYLGYYLYINYYLPSTITLPPPLANVEFPSEQTRYPADWPKDLKFPDEFKPVDFSSGLLPENSTKGWSAKFKYQGEASEVTKIISGFFENKGWTIIEHNELDSGGSALLIQREQGSGVIVIDTDATNSSQTLIIVTLFP